MALDIAAGDRYTQPRGPNAALYLCPVRGAIACAGSPNAARLEAVAALRAAGSGSNTRTTQPPA